MFILNSRGVIIAPLTDVDPSKLDGCTILARVTNKQASRIRFVSLNSKSKLGFVTSDEAMFYEFINNSSVQKVPNRIE